MIGRSKLAYYADNHARHDRVKLCNLRNEKHENVNTFMYCFLRLIMPVLVVGLYFDANVVHISNILFFFIVLRV